MTLQRIAVVGLGLIGGSFAKRLRDMCPTSTCIGVDADLDTLATAQAEGVIVSGLTSPLDLPKNLDLIVVCTPIEFTRQILLDLASHVDPSCILSDVASVKQVILENLDIPNIVGGHPIAGTEFSGYSASFSELLDNAPYILVPTPKNTAACARLSHFLRDTLGCRVAELCAKDHDEQIATTSHLPYLVATLTAAYALKAGPHPLLFGPGFASTTRVAKSNPDWGVAVCQTNTDGIMKGLKNIRTLTEQLEQLIETKQWDKLRAMLLEIGTFRKTLD